MPGVLDITSLRGGMNNTDDAIALADDQVVLAENVEWTRSRLGERRRGGLAIDLTGSPFASCDRIVWAHRHLPTTDHEDAQLWLMGITDPSTVVLGYKDTTWHTVTMPDAMTVDGWSEYQVCGQTLHGKLHLAYNSSVDRLHVWETGLTALRRSGLAEPDAPTAADTGSAGSFSGTRYYRVRYTVQDGAGATLRRSEPSEVLEFSPSGSKNGAVITKPASISEDETHWECEASLNKVDFYVIATTAVGTTTVTDTANSSNGYAASFVLSEDIGNYTVPHAARILIADEDRLLLFGSFEDDTLESSASWTPVYNDTGDGNDERIPLDPVSVVNLDSSEGGAITDASRATAGDIYVGKDDHVYRLVRTGVRSRAYEAHVVSKQRGVIPQSMVDAIDEAGNPTVYFLDKSVGPNRITASGSLQRCGRDLWETWKTVNLDATVVCRSIYYAQTQQVQWRVATGSNLTPNAALVLHTDQIRVDAIGEARGGFSYWTGDACAALTCVLFSDNIDDDTDRSHRLVPLIGGDHDGLVWQMDTGSDDNGAAFTATLTTKPYAPGQLQKQIEITTGSVMALAASGVGLVVSAIPNFAVAQARTADAIDLSPAATETVVQRQIDDLGLAECLTVQFSFTDPTDQSGRWELARFSAVMTGGFGAG
jgi:hypothetical protein